MTLIILKNGIFEKAGNEWIEILNIRTSPSPRSHWYCDDEVRGSSVVGAGSSSRRLWHLGARPAQSQNGCSFVPQRWQTYCIALCTRQTAGSCRAEFKGRPALAAGADWLCSRLVTAGSTAAPLGWPRPLTSAVVGGRTRWRVASCAVGCFLSGLCWCRGRGRGREFWSGLSGGRLLSGRIVILAVLRPGLEWSAPHPTVFSWAHSWNSCPLLEKRHCNRKSPKSSPLGFFYS